MANPINVDRSWKRALTKNPELPFCSLVSMWDMLFYWDPEYPKNKSERGAWLTRFDQSVGSGNVTPGDYRMKGVQLAHTTILFNENMYEPDIGAGHRMIDQEVTTFDTFSKHGFDISLPQFDMRTKPLFLNSNTVTTYIKPTATITEAMIKNELAGLINILSPQIDSSDYFYTSRPGIKVFAKNAAMIPANTYEVYSHSPYCSGSHASKNSWTDYPTPPTVGAENDGLSHISNANIVLTQKDFTFMKRFSLDAGFSAYDGMLFNWTKDDTWKIPYRTFGGNADKGTWSTGLMYVTEGVAQYDIAPVAKFLLQNCFVFVKNSFYADYIDYHDFNQKLSPDSDTKHKNVIVANVGDFDRFNSGYKKGDEGFDNNRDLAINTRPYVPVTTPTVDKLSPKLLPSTQWNPADKYKTLQNLIANSVDPSSLIGSLYSEPFEMGIDGVTSGDESPTSTPPMYFDPSSRKDAAAYDEFPIVMPRDGNLVVNGRITSPTIDELWAAIKSMAAGRMVDPLLGGTPLDGGYPVGEGERRNPNDTRLKIRDFKFQGVGGGYSKGDPTEISYEWSIDESKTPASYRIDTWVNDPSKILYSYLAELIAFNDLLAGAYTVGSIKTWKFVYNSLSALNVPTQYEIESKVMSLRELEATCKGLRWNFAFLLEVLERDYVPSGRLGRPNTDERTDLVNKAAGTAYALHQEYNGIDGAANDPTTNLPAQPSNTMYDLRFNSRIDDQGQYSSAPMGAPGKGVGILTRAHFPGGTYDPQALPSWAVYMGADGNWHSSAQAMILPIESVETW
jgi:hypothetical protein